MAAAKQAAPQREALALRVDALRRENTALRAELERARAGATTGPRRPPRPPYALSEGERQDLLIYGVSRSPWTGETMTASDHNLEPNTEQGRAAQDAEQKRRNAQGRTRDANRTPAPTDVDLPEQQPEQPQPEQQDQG